MIQGRNHRDGVFHALLTYLRHARQAGRKEANHQIDAVRSRKQESDQRAYGPRIGAGAVNQPFAAAAPMPIYHALAIWLYP